MINEPKESKRADLFPVTLAELALLLFFLLALLATAEIQERDAKTEKLQTKIETFEEIAPHAEEILILKEKAKETNDDFYELVRQAAHSYRMADSLADINNNLQGQITNLRRRAGLDLPPCWANIEGKPEYIYSVTIHEEYLQIKGIWPEHRNDDIQHIPGAVNLVSDSMAIEEFTNAAQPILNWSNQQKCRHFVEIYDNAKSKNSFKWKLLTVERFFYKFLQ